jgi:hypothetical protein
MVFDPETPLTADRTTVGSPCSPATPSPLGAAPSSRGKRKLGWQGRGGGLNGQVTMNNATAASLSRRGERAAPKRVPKRLKVLIPLCDNAGPPSLTLMQLPDEMLLECASFLIPRHVMPTGDFYSLQAVNKRMQYILNSSRFWSGFGLTDVGSGRFITVAYRFIKRKCSGTEGACFQVVQRGTESVLALRKGRVMYEVRRSVYIYKYVVYGMYVMYVCMCICIYIYLWCPIVIFMRHVVWLLCMVAYLIASILCYAILYYVVLCCAILSYAMLCYPILCCAMLSYPMLCCAMDRGARECRTFCFGKSQRFG